MKEQRFFQDTDRYIYDFKLKKHFAQIDTSQDAHYYGNWASPIEFKIITYAEGDHVIKTCESKEEFVAEMNELISWQKYNQYWKGIDPGFNEPGKQAWIDLGFEEFLH
jgi:hypothetical protein